MNASQIAISISTTTNHLLITVQYIERPECRRCLRKSHHYHINFLLIRCAVKLHVMTTHAFYKSLDTSNPNWFYNSRLHLQSNNIISRCNSLPQSFHVISTSRLHSLTAQITSFFLIHGPGASSSARNIILSINPFSSLQFHTISHSKLTPSKLHPNHQWYFHIIEVRYLSQKKINETPWWNSSTFNSARFRFIRN